MFNKLLIWERRFHKVIIGLFSYSIKFIDRDMIKQWKRRKLNIINLIQFSHFSVDLISFIWFEFEFGTMTNSFHSFGWFYKTKKRCWTRTHLRRRVSNFSPAGTDKGSENKNRSAKKNMTPYCLPNAVCIVEKSRTSHKMCLFTSCNFALHAEKEVSIDAVEPASDGISSGFILRIFFNSISYQIFWKARKSSL